ncbi:MAG: hypothetical protein OQJ77_06855 [Thiovulaceae bacterium]|jgi:hypothetical protein|nr:hypothetical protein [Sulfurimonadaceae bacterium]MCW9027021.1 hypothetical protein [Sulfurimonadaceae bacterium]
MINSVALTLLLGFELSFYLLIVQTGITEHFNSDLFKLFPIFVGGVSGTLLAGFNWGRFNNPIHKIITALSIQFIMSFLYPSYNSIELFILGLAIGMMAPLGIYLFKQHQQLSLFFALAIAYTVGTYNFTSAADERVYIAILFSTIVLLSALTLRDFIVEKTKETHYKVITFIPLVLWILLDSNLFETLSRHPRINIWDTYTYIIISFHLLGLISAYFINIKENKQHIIIFTLFVISYSLSYLELPFALAIVYPFVISYYNVIVFTSLTKLTSLKELSFVMVFVGWIASGTGLALALSKLLH